MADDMTETGAQDRSRINVTEPFEVEYWTKRLTCTEAQLKAAVMAVGAEVMDVQVQLQK